MFSWNSLPAQAEENVGVSVKGAWPKSFRHWWSAAVLSCNTPDSSKTLDIRGTNSTFVDAAGENTRAPVFGQHAFKLRQSNRSVPNCDCVYLGRAYLAIAGLHVEAVSPENFPLVPYPKEVHVAEGRLQLKRSSVIQVKRA